MLRVRVVKSLGVQEAAQTEFDKMLSAEHWTEDKVLLCKTRAAELFKQGHAEMAAAHYTRAIGIHACKGTEAGHALYGNRSACRCAAGDHDAALADAEECIRLSPAWAKGYVRKGAALHGLYRFDDAVAAYEHGLTHEPALAALTEGLNDALRRRKADGWVGLGGSSGARAT